MIPFCRRRPFPNENSIRVLAAVYYELPVSAGRSHQRGLHNTLHACVYYVAITPDHKTPTMACSCWSSTEIEEKSMQQTPEQLRRRAAEIRQAAHHAERLADARDELAQADQLEAEADRLEGKVRPVPEQPVTSPPMSPAERERLRRERIEEACAQIARRLGQKR